MLTPSLPPILESSEPIELWSQACVAAKGGRRGERWEESFCCYVLWESPVWRIYGLADSESWHGNVVCRSATVKQLRQPPKHSGGKVLSCSVCCKSPHVTRVQRRSNAACVKSDLLWLDMVTTLLLHTCSHQLNSWGVHWVMHIFSCQIKHLLIVTNKTFVKLTFTCSLVCQC